MKETKTLVWTTPYTNLQNPVSSQFKVKNETKKMAQTTLKESYINY